MSSFRSLSPPESAWTVCPGTSSECVARVRRRMEGTGERNEIRNKRSTTCPVYRPFQPDAKGRRDHVTDFPNALPRPGSVSEAPSNIWTRNRYYHTLHGCLPFVRAPVEEGDPTQRTRVVRR